MGRLDEDSTAFAHRRSPFLLNCLARTQNPAELPPTVEWARRTREEMSRFGSGVYVNFTGEGGAERAAYPPQTYARLAEVKRNTTRTTSSGSTRTFHRHPRTDRWSRNGMSSSRAAARLVVSSQAG